MRLRKLEMKDAPYMLEWMHDKDVVQNLQANFEEKTIEDCTAFILSSIDDKENLHLAVVDEHDTYMGTVSLKHIDEKLRTAEFAIAIRTVALKNGYSKYAMTEIIRKGVEELNLKKIYWCVSKDNVRAIRFYDKNGYQRLNTIPIEYCENYGQGQIESYLWYQVEKNK